MARRRTSRGRQRIDIRRIENQEKRQVCFSKRRAGLFKKASDLAIMCGVNVAAVVFSPSLTRVFSFGHPSVKAVMERFAPTGLVAAAGGGAGAGEDNRQLAELNRQHGELKAKLNAEKVRKERVDEDMAKERAAANPVAPWLESHVRDLGEEELMAYAAALKDVQAAVAARDNQLRQDALDHGRAMARLSNNNNNQVQPPQQQFLFLLPNNGAAAFVDQFGAGSSSANNNGRAMTCLSNNNNQVQPPQQQFILPNNGAVRFVDQFGAGSSSSSASNNNAEMDMQIQQLLMAMSMPPPPGFAPAGMDPMGFGGFPGPY